MEMLNCFNGKKILVTGHTGFKGSWLSLWLNKLDADVYGISIDVPTKPSHFVCTDLSSHINDYRIDITDLFALKNLINDIQPDFVFHLAAQALVRTSYESPIETIITNSIGTLSCSGYIELRCNTHRRTSSINSLLFV